MIYGITGANGFIGQHLLTYLEKNNLQYLKLDLNFSEDKDFRLVDHVFHLAARTSISKSWYHPLEFMVTDIISACFLTLPTSSFQTYCVGTGLYSSVEEVIQIALSVCKITKPYYQKNIERTNEVKFPYMDCSLIRQTGWLSKISLKEGIQL